MLFMLCFVFFFFFFKQKTAYEMRISDWSSDVCSSDLGSVAGRLRAQHRCRQGHAAQLGAWSQASQRPRPGAARHDREEALAGERAAALTAFMADREAGRDAPQRTRKFDQHLTIDRAPGRERT